MAKHGDRLHIYSYSGPDPEMNIDDAQWRKLEQAYSRSISSEMRAELLRLSHRYLFSRRSELGAATQRDVADIATEVRKAISGFSSFAYGAYLEFSRAERNSEELLEFEARFSSIAEKPESLIQLRGGNLRDLTAEPLDFDASSVRLCLTPSLLNDIAIQLNVVLNRIIRGDEAIAGFVPGDAFKQFLLDVKLWAKQHKLPHAPYAAASKAAGISNKSSAGPIARLCFNLEKLFPEEYRAHPASDTAVAAQIERQFQLRQRIEAAKKVGALKSENDTE